MQFAEAGKHLHKYEEWPVRATASALYYAEHAYRKARQRSTSLRRRSASETLRHTGGFDVDTIAEEQEQVLPTRKPAR